MNPLFYPGKSLPRLLNDIDLQKSEVVANSAMNRQRQLAGGNSYIKELGFDPVAFLRHRLLREEGVAWVDLCCGSGRALIEAAHIFRESGFAHRITLIGVDLVPMFDVLPPALTFLRFQESPLLTWEPDQQFDLITCVHGLHYIGDKLGMLTQTSNWLKRDGLFAAHLDYANIRLSDLRPVRSRIGKDLWKAGFRYAASRHLLTCQGRMSAPLPYRYLGADAGAGPNYTGQPAVNSYYRVEAR